MATLKFKDINKIYDNKVQAVFDFNLDEIISSSIIYIVKHGENHFLLISSGEMLLDPKLTLIEKIHLEDIIKEIAKELR